jgi:hypothetical protein
MHQPESRVAKTWVWIAVACGVLAVTVLAWAQGGRAGLWEVTTTMTWQQSPFPNGMGPGAAPRTTQVCLSQQQADKFGGVPPQSRGDCQVTNINKRIDGYTAEVTCTGQMTTNGTVEATYTADGHGKTRMHLTGTMQMGPNPRPVEMTILNEATYKGADCGSVKPVETK